MSLVLPRRSRRTVSPSKGDLKEQALLAAGGRLLAEARFNEASVADLAREAGLERASFYFYFASKQALLGAVVTQAVAEFSRRLGTELAADGEHPPGDLVAATVRAAADLWWGHRVAMVTSVELGGSVPEVYEQSMRNLALVREPTVELLRRHGKVPEAEDAEEASSLVTALILMSERNFYDLARGNAARADYDALADRLIRIWQRAFGL